MKPKIRRLSGLAAIALAGAFGALTPKGEAAQMRLTPELARGPINTGYEIEEARFHGLGIDVLLDSAYESVQNKPSYITKRFIKEVARTESRFNPYAKSYMDARGLMQLTERAWEQVDTSDYMLNVYDPYINLQDGIKYFVTWIDPYCAARNPDWGNLSDSEKRKIALAAYNAGTRRTEELGWDVSNMSPGVQDYVNNIESRVGDIE